MSSDEKDIYHLEPEGAPLSAKPAPPLQESRPETPTGPTPTKADDEVWDKGFLLEGEGATNCPDCGAPLTDPKEVVCLRCGFDLSRMAKIETKTGVEERDPTADEEAAEKPPIVSPGRGGLNLPAIVAGAAAVIVTIGFLFGASGLFRTGDGKFPDASDKYTLMSPTFGARAVGALRVYLITAIFAVGVLAGLRAVGWIDRRRLGDGNIALVRCFAVASCCTLALYLPTRNEWYFVWFALEFTVMAGLYFGLMRLFFDLSPRQIALAGGVGLAAAFIARMLASIIA